MGHLVEIGEYWDQRANGFDLAVDEELEGRSAEEWMNLFEKYIAEGAEVLDDGTGPGFFPLLLVKRNCKITAIDYSTEMVEKTKKRLEKAGCTARVLQMDAQDLKFSDNSFDVVVSRNVIWNLDDPEKAYQEIHRVLRPGGKLILDDGNMYLHLHNPEYAAAREERMKKVQQKHLHDKHNVDNVDFTIIEKIAEELPMSRTLRPQWDFDQLVRLGFDDISVSIRGGALPMGFRIIAEKRKS